MAFSSFRARISGFCSSLVLLSLARNENEPPGTLKAKLPTVKPPPPVAPAAAAMLELTPMFSDVGTFMPRVRSRSRFTCITATSITTSGLGLSMADSSLSARIIWSGVPRTIRASCAASS